MPDARSNTAQNSTQTKIPTRIREAKRVIEHIAEPIPALGIERELDERIGAEEPPDCRIVNSPIHMDESEIIQLRVPREPTACGVSDVGVIGAIDRP